MTVSTFALVILAAFIHASWNLLAKKAAGGAPFVLLGVFAVALIWGPVVLIWGWNRPELITDFTITQWLFLALSAIVHIAYALALQRGYQTADYGVVYPIARGTGPLIASIVAIVFLGEAVTLISALGILAIVSGIFVLAGGLGALKDASPRARAGVKWGATTGACIAAYTTIDGYAVKHLLIAPILLDYVCNALRAIFMSPMLLTHREEIRAEWKKNWRYIVIISIISPIAYILVLTAMQTAPISHVAPLREISMLFAAVFGVKLLREERLGEKLVGAALMVIGVVGLLWR
ncbi:MAG: EamA family transporter [Burkholderiales bacterium]|nr:MAG: EamA family transporter [Burkholderiales bacterium]TAG80452.1 MAG: EamA family transporter [Betaproteobacteria bacterium]